MSASSAVARAYLVPPMTLGPAPSLDTARQRAGVIEAYAESFGVDPLIAAEHDPAAYDVLFRDRLRRMGVL